MTYPPIPDACSDWLTQWAHLRSPDDSVLYLENSRHDRSIVLKCYGAIITRIADEDHDALATIHRFWPTVVRALAPALYQKAEEVTRLDDLIYMLNREAA